MEFRLAGPTDRKLVEDLWAYCFEPRENPFFQWYFSAFYKPENVLMGFKNKEMACLTHLNPYELSLREKKIPVSYIVGLATHPAARRGGVGGKLLSAALKEMRRRKQYLNILMPSKAGFYQHYGYEMYCHQWKETIRLEELRPLTDKTVRFGFVNNTDQWTYLATVYDAYTRSVSGYAVRDEASWRSHIEAQLAEGYIAVAFQDDQPIAYVFYSLGGETIVSGEFVYSSWKGKRGLLDYIYNHRSQGKIFQWNEGLQDQSYRFYPDGKQGHETMPFMAGRVVDVKGALEQIPYPKGAEGVVTFHTEDPLAEWNTGSFTLAVKDGMGCVTAAGADEAEIFMPIGTLALLIFGAVDVNGLVFYEKLRGSDAALATLDEFFPRTNCYINEWY